MQKTVIPTERSMLGRAGGAYIPPAKLKQLHESITDKTSEDYQRLTWEALKKSINGLINKVLILK
jgi:pre-mRNA-splicing factor CWC22